MRSAPRTNRLALPLPPRHTEPHHHSWRPPVCPRPHCHAILSSSPSTL
jgi:hypothetical protein